MPWAPVYVEQTAYPAQSLTSTGTKPAASGPRPNRLNSTQDPQVSLLARAYSGFDQGASQGNDVVIGKGDQAITIGGKNLNVYLPGGKTWIGDLNGDGHDDIAVASTTGDASSGQQPMVLISGTVGPGAHDPFAVGVRLPASADQGKAFGVGDINGDGADDVAMASGSQTVIVSGRDVMAPGPGGRIDQIPAPIAVVPANDGGWFTLAPKTYPVLARVNGASLDFVTTPTVSLRIDGDPAALLSSPEISGYLSHGHRIIVAKYDSGRSGMTQTEMWNLDAPCSSTK